MPAGLIVLFILGAIAVDLTLVRSARQELASQVQSAVDDAAASADTAALSGTDRTVINLDQAQRIVAATFEGATLGRGTERPPIHWEVRAGASPDTVVVSATGDVPLLFARAVPGLPTTMRVTATATARRIQI